MILVVAEQRRGVLNRATWEAIAGAQQIGAEVSVLVLGHKITAIASEIARVTARAAELFDRNASLSPVERDELYGLWDYGKRLAFINVFLAVAQPAPMSSADVSATEAAFRSAVAKHGSATDDNLAAFSQVHLAQDEREGVSLRLGPLGQPLGDLLLDAVDVVGTAEFFASHLAGLPELRRLSPTLWESAYRILMLTTDALFTCPRHSKAEQAG